MVFGKCWEIAFYLLLTSEKKVSAIASGELPQWRLVGLQKGREAVFNVLP